MKWSLAAVVKWARSLRRARPQVVHYANSDGHPLCYRRPTRPRRGSTTSPLREDVTCRRCLAALAAPVEPGIYCARCHLTEPMHHLPNIYTGRKDALGHPYPPPCDQFTPAPVEPEETRR